MNEYQPSLALREQESEQQGFQKQARTPLRAKPSSPNTATVNHPRPSRRRRIACRYCRQDKSRCEGSDLGNKPCDRCAEFSRECVFDTDYRRVNKRLKLDELQQEVEQLRSQAQAQTHAAQVAQVPQASDVTTLPSYPAFYNTQQQSSPSFNRQPPFLYPTSSDHAMPASSNDQNVQIGLVGTANILPSMNIREIATQSSSYSVSGARSLDQISLTATQIGHLFDSYFAFYHPFFPVLDRSASPDAIYSVSPLLFWTIIFITARTYDDDLSLVGALLPPLKNLLWSIISAPPHALLSLQAMSLLCMWPFQTSTSSTDISYMLVGIMISGALHVGLHRPEIVQDFSRRKYQLGPQELNEAAKSWVGCFIAAENVTVSIGQLSYFERDPTIEKACGPFNPYRLTANLYYQLLCHKFCNRIHFVMNGNYDSEMEMRMKILEQDYEALTRHAEDAASQINSLGSAPDMHSLARANLLMLSAQLQLRTYYLFDDSDSSTRKQGVVGAYSTALELIFAVQAADKNGMRVKYLPHSYLRFCYLAAIVVMKVANSSYSHFVNTESGKSAFNTVISISRQSSIEDNDLPGRMSKILAQLWSVHRSLARETEQPPTLEIKTRSLYSIVHDSLWLWRERFSGRPGNGEPTPQPPLLSASQTIRNPEPPYIPSATNPFISQNEDDQDIQCRLVNENMHPASFTPNSSNTSLGPSREDENWMWNVGIPSLSNVDLQGFAIPFNTEYG